MQTIFSCIATCLLSWHHSTPPLRVQRAQQVSAVVGIKHSFTVPEISGTFSPYLYTVDAAGLAAPGGGVIAGIVVVAVIVIVAIAVGLGTVITLLYR